MVRGVLQDKNLNAVMPLFWTDRTNLPPITEAAQDPLTFRRTVKGKPLNTNTKRDLNNAHPITVEVLIRPKYGHNTEPGSNRIKLTGPSTRSATPTPKPEFTRRVSSLKDGQRQCERPKLKKTVSCTAIRPIGLREESRQSRVANCATLSRECSATLSKSTITSSRPSSNESTNRTRPILNGRTAKCGSNRISLAQNEDVSQINSEKRQTANEQFLDGKTKNRIIRWLTEVETARQISETKTQSIPRPSESSDTTELSNDLEQSLPIIDEEDAQASIR